MQHPAIRLSRTPRLTAVASDPGQGRLVNERAVPWHLQAFVEGQHDRPAWCYLGAAKLLCELWKLTDQFG